MKVRVFDIEADGLLVDCTKLHVICIYCFSENKLYTFHDDSWKAFLSDSDIIVGHNITGYDLVALEKLTRFVMPITTVYVDTLTLSEILNYRRFGHQQHSLEVWGEHLGFPKIDWRAHAISLGLIEESDPKGAEFIQYHPAMDDYCKQDVRVNARVYQELLPEYIAQYKKKPEIKTFVKAQNATAIFCARAELHGWPFDKEAAIALQKKLEKVVEKAEEELTPKLGLKCTIKDRAKSGDNFIDVIESAKIPEKDKEWLIESMVIDGIPANFIMGAIPKVPKWVKNGMYDKHTADYFGVEPESGFIDPELDALPFHRTIRGPFSRITIEPMRLSSTDDVKRFLFRVGWKPTAWNYKQNPETGKKEISSPKITEDSLEFLGGDGELYTKYAIASSRLSILNTWLENLDNDNNLHGKCRTLGTPSLRATHSVIVNVPDPHSDWGSEFRSLFKCKPGWKIVGCDSKGNQARGLAFYLKSEEYTRILLEEDIHNFNKDKLTEVLHTLDVDGILSKAGKNLEVSRGAAKRILYAFLFGASGAKLWSYIFGEVDSEYGNKLKDGFLAAVPGFKDLIDELKRIYRASARGGYGWIPSIVGSKVFVDSLHKLLVYLLQSLEKITCATAVWYFMCKAEEENIPYIPLIFMHDEFQIMTPEKYADRCLEIGVEAFREGPKLYGVSIMDGDGKIGNNWLETH